MNLDKELRQQFADNDLRQQFADNDLYRQFERRNPPAGFVDRVMARLPAERVVWSGWRGLAAAGVVLAMLAGPYAYQRKSRDNEAIAARDQLITAFRVAGVRLHNTKARVLEAGRRTGEQE